MKFYTIGSLNIDYVYEVPHFVRPGETLSSTKRNIFPGGKGLNQSVALSKAGAVTIHGGLIGSDGDILLDTLKDAGVETKYIKRLPSPSGHTIIQVDENGQNCIILFGGANQMFDTEYIDDILSEAENGDLLLLQNEINALDLIMEKAHEKGMQVALNPSPFDDNIRKLPLKYVNWWLLNEIEGESLTGKNEPEEIVSTLFNEFPDSNIVLTLGKSGAIFKNKDYKCYQPIFSVKAVDTTAAGDTFTGYFLTQALNGKCPQEALKIASVASAIAVSRNGAAVSIPALQEVNEFLKLK